MSLPTKMTRAPLVILVLLGLDYIFEGVRIMSNQKKRARVAPPALLNTKHKDSTPVVSPILAPTGTRSISSSVSPKNNIVLTGIDTFHLTAGGAVSPSRWLIDKQQVWREYQQSFDYALDEHLHDQINQDWFEIKPYGMKQYSFILFNPEVAHIRVWNVDKWASAVNASQHIYIDFAASWLKKWKNGNDLKNAIKSLLSVFFDDCIDLVNIKVSRGDLFADITNGNTFLSEEQVKNVITKSKYRNYFVEDDTIQLTDSERDYLKTSPSYNKGGQKLIPVTLLQKLAKIAENQISIGADNIVHKREIETAYYGKKTSDIWGKFYDKTKCCKVKNDLDTPLLWIENGWNGNDTIVRFEISMRRGFIKELNNGSYVSLDAFVDNVSSIWEWITTKWIRMVTEVKRNNIQLSPISKFWMIIQSAFHTPTNNIIRKRNFEGKINQLIKQGLGCLAQAGAMGMNNESDIYFINSLSKSITESLSLLYHNGDIDSRRMRMGLLTCSP